MKKYGPKTDPCGTQVSTVGIDFGTVRLYGYNLFAK